MAKRAKSKKYVFIDTNVFINILFMDSDGKILKKFLKLIKKEKAFLIIPENIKREIEFILYEESFFLRDEIYNSFLKNALLLLEDKTKQDKSEVKEAILNGFKKSLEKHKELLLKDSNDFCKLKQNEFKDVCDCGYTKCISISEESLLNGIKRSLMKLAPFTSPLSKKKRENTHLKDSDCITFETILSFLKEEKSNKKTNLSFIMCVSDKDYTTEDEKILKDIENELKDFNLIHCKNLEEIFKKGFNEKEKKGKKEKKVKTLDGGQKNITEDSLVVGGSGVALSQSDTLN